MNDLIARLRGLSEFMRGLHPVEKDFIEACDEAADALEQRWIPCSERLPEPCTFADYGSWVLVWNGYHRGVACLRDHEDGEPPRWVDEVGEYVSPAPLRWQELPPPPESVE